jgi:hypothetical protein
MTQPADKKLPLNKDKLLNTITIGLFVLGILCVAYVVISNLMKNRETSRIGNLDCVKETKVVTVQDEHMAGYFEKNASAQVLENFYNCNAVTRGDFAWYRFSPQIDPVIRVVRGVPGDKYTLTEYTEKEKKGQWTISINGETVKAGNQDYYIQSNTVPPLKTYELSRGGVLGADEYILLSNVPPGLSDSSNLGLIDKKSLVGKAIKK